MANLVKIKEVYLYVGLTADSQDCYNAKVILEQNNIPYTLLAYYVDSQHQGVFDALSSWTWTGNVQRTFTQFPIVTWKNFYDDYETDLGNAQGVTELQNSVLVANKTLVE